VRVKVITRFCFAMGIRVSARHFSGNKDYSRGRGVGMSADKLGCQFCWDVCVIRV